MTNGERFQRGVAGGMQYLSACMTVAGGARAAPTKVKCFFRGGCFVAGTQIVTAEGLKNIEDIQAGDMVWSRSDKTGEEGFKRVLAAWETHPPSLIHLYYRRATESASHAAMRAAEGDDHYIVGTSNHPFWSETRQQWIELGELQIGEYIHLADGGLATVEYTWEEWAPEGSTFTTYNFEVADWHTYFVVPEGETDPRVGTWVHNAAKVGQYAGAKDAKKDVTYRNGWRTRDGKFASPKGAGRSGKAAEEIVWDDLERKFANKPGWEVKRGQIGVRDASGKLRYYDGVVRAPNGKYIGIETKSGTAVKSPAQRAFDSGVSAGSPAKGVGQNTGVEVRRVWDFRQD